MSQKFSTEPMGATRLALGIEYDGSAYCGWQVQKKPAVPSIQACIESAIGFVANHPVSTICAGRTDAGVHATFQVVHFDTESSRSEKAWVCGVNANLPDDICVRWVKPVGEEFSARFSAESRTYRYIILNDELRPAILHSKVTHIKPMLDAASMHEAGQYLLGEHDFSAYRGAGCQSRSVHRNIETIKVARHGKLIITEITANAFLLHMIRNIMGVLIAIGEGNKPEIWAKEVLETRDRTKAGKTAPADGLYFVHVSYPPCFDIPKIEKGPVFIES